jgi:cellulose synthase/poly-beta-1,6-N-acetylglucosamine synthase-like glycosyltransferase
MLWFWVLTAAAAVNLLTALAAFKRRRVRPLERHPAVTIIVRTWDDDHIVPRFIEGCLAQDYPGKIQIIIADDASNDRTPEVVKPYVKAKQIQYIRAKQHHKWKAHFLNPIIKKHVKGEILVNTDIDAGLPPNYVTEMVRALQTCDAVSSTCVGGNPHTLVSRVRIVEDLWLYAASMAGRTALTNQAAMYGGSHAVWMKVLKEVGYYSTKTMTEDAELTVTLNQAGYRTCFCDRTTVLLEDVETFGQFLNERKRWIWGPIDMAKHYGGFHPYNILFAFNVFLSTIALFSGAAAFFAPIFAIPFGISLFTLLLAFIKARAKLFTYPWIVPYILFDPLLELASILGIIKDTFLGKGVKWVKITGTKYHIGRQLVPVFGGVYDAPR